MPSSVYPGHAAFGLDVCSTLRTPFAPNFDTVAQNEAVESSQH